jgi:hypothetical protein
MWLEYAEDLADDSLFVGHDKEEAGDDDGVDGIGLEREGVRVGVLKAAVEEVETSCAGFSAFDEGLGEVDSDRGEMGQFFRESTGIKAGAAADFDETGSRLGRIVGKQRVSDLLGVIAEEVLAAKRVKPGAPLEEAVGLVVRRARDGLHERMGSQANDGKVVFCPIHLIHVGSP